MGHNAGNLSMQVLPNITIGLVPFLDLSLQVPSPAREYGRCTRTGLFEGLNRRCDMTIPQLELYNGKLAQSSEEGEK